VSISSSFSSLSGNLLATTYYTLIGLKKLLQIIIYQSLSALWRPQMADIFVFYPGVMYSLELGFEPDCTKVAQA